MGATGISWTMEENPDRPDKASFTSHQAFLGVFQWWFVKKEPVQRRDGVLA